MNNRLFLTLATAFLCGSLSAVTLRNGCSADKKRVDEVYEAIRKNHISKHTDWHGWILWRECNDSRYLYPKTIETDSLFFLLTNLYKDGKLDQEAQKAIIDSPEPFSKSLCNNITFRSFVNLCKEAQLTGAVLKIEDRPTFQLLSVVYKNGVMDKETKDIIRSAYCGTGDPKIINWRYPVMSKTEKILSKLPGYKLINLYFGRIG